MKKNPDFEENYFSKTAEGIHKISHYSIRTLKCLCYADRPLNENSYYSDLMATVLTCPIEVSFWWLLCRSKKHERYNICPNETLKTRQRNLLKSLRTQYQVQKNNKIGKTKNFYKR